jgi:hypothetical protein
VHYILLAVSRITARMKALLAVSGGDVDVLCIEAPPSNALEFDLIAIAVYDLPVTGCEKGCCCCVQAFIYCSGKAKTVRLSHRSILIIVKFWTE